MHNRASCFTPVLLPLALAFWDASAEPYSFEVSGSCSFNSDIDDIYAPVNTTVDGRWYYRGQSHGLFVYFDPDCDGPNGANSSQDSWLFDIDEPSRTASSDLDGDGECLNSGAGFNAQINNNNTAPPIETTLAWVWCGFVEGLVNLNLTLVLTGGPTFPPTVSAQPTFSPSVGCLDLDGDASDPYGDGCEVYIPSWCGVYDSSDFTSNAMCCVCGGGSLTDLPTQTPSLSSPPTVSAHPTVDSTLESCPDSCFGYTCDHWSTTCVVLEAYSCSCFDCDCGLTPAPTVSTPPSITPSPTTGRDVATFMQLETAVAWKLAWITIVAARIAISSTLFVDGYEVHISGSTKEGGAVLDGGGSVRFFSVTNGGRLVLEHLKLTNGFASFGGGVRVSSGTLFLSSCTMSSNTASVSGKIFFWY